MEIGSERYNLTAQIAENVFNIHCDKNFIFYEQDAGHWARQFSLFVRHYRARHCRQRRVYHATKAIRGKVQFNLAVELGGQPSLDHAGTEAAPLRRLNSRTTHLLPKEAQSVRRPFPANLNVSLVGRECTVFSRVGHQLMQSHG